MSRFKLVGKLAELVRYDNSYDGYGYGWGDGSGFGDGDGYGYDADSRTILTTDWLIIETY